MPNDADATFPELPGETLAIWGAIPGARLAQGPAWLANDERSGGHRGVGYIEAPIKLPDGDYADVAVEVLDEDTYTLHITAGPEIAVQLLNDLAELSGAAG